MKAIYSRISTDKQNDAGQLGSKPGRQQTENSDQADRLQRDSLDGQKNKKYAAATDSDDDMDMDLDQDMDSDMDLDTDLADDMDESGSDRGASFDRENDDDARIVDATENKRGSTDSGMGANKKKNSTQEKSKRPGNEPH